MRTTNDQVINEAMAASIKGARYDCTNIGLLSVQVKNSGVATTGVLKLQGSALADPTTADADWVDISGATVNVTSASTYGFSVADLAWKWVRPVYSQAGGTGTLQAWFNGKGF